MLRRNKIVEIAQQDAEGVAQLAVDLVRETLHQRHRSDDVLTKVDRGHPQANDVAPKLVHHGDRRSQHLSIRYTERLAEAGIDTSVGSVGDSYDNALAESIIGLFKTEVIKFLGPWKSVGQVEWETLKWVDWYNKTRLHSAIGYVTPNEAEEAFYASLNADEKAA